MNDPTLTIIACPQCGVKNRIRSLRGEQIPVCAKCKGHLMTEKENESHLKYQASLKNFQGLPDLGLRFDKD
ncbi:MAG: hypothetical protein COV66_00965 [Nitrospinae bacterium CG11_big_fil_rev_8_21_14_0_20_45_15]|nr:MAG: hypothetical protein COV66_00965 [Nitrospinae bacterium CG11_big_fil_rev_8_21_14_0_20_45_15]